MVRGSRFGVRGSGSRFMVRGSGSRFAGLTLAIVSSIWAVVILAAPYAVTHASGESGALRGAAFPYLVGRFVCHQRPDRSFRAWGAQLPVCSRCAGLYFTAPLGALVALTHRRRRRVPNARLRVILVTAALPLAIAWALEA